MKDAGLRGRDHLVLASTAATRVLVLAPLAVLILIDENGR